MEIFITSGTTSYVTLAMSVRQAAAILKAEVSDDTEEAFYMFTDR